MLRADIVIPMFLYIVFAPVVGGLIAGIDRKITARMQGRKGPSIFQAFYDVRKLISKETLVVNREQFVFAVCFLIFVVFSGALFFGGRDILLIFFTLTTSAMFLVIAAMSVNSPFSVMGAQRELVQMLAYEPMVLIAAVGFYKATDSFKVYDIVRADLPAIIYLPGVFAGFVFILTIKMRKSPFDLSTSHHAHQELVKGVTTELSGGMFALYEIAEWYEHVFLLGIVAMFFINSSWWSIPVAIAVCALVCVIEALIDNTSARVKWDVMLKMSWGVTMVLGAVNIFVLEYIK